MNPLTSFLVTCCALLSAVIIIELFYYDNLSVVSIPVHAHQSPSGKQDTKTRIKFPPISHFRVIKDRPLFSASRRPIRVTLENPSLLYQLRGILISKKHRIAILESLTNGTSVRVEEGDAVDEWTILAIQDRAIQLRFANFTQERILTLTDNVSSNLGESNRQARAGHTHQGERQSDKAVLANTKRREDRIGRACLPRECRVLTSEARDTRQASVADIAPPLPPPPTPNQVPDRY